MEPRREEPKAPTPRPEEKPKRFQLIRLEECIAPSKGGNQTNDCVGTKACNGVGGGLSIE